MYKMRIVTWFSRKRISENFKNIFNGTTSPRVYTYHCVLVYFLTMPLGFNFNLTYGLTPQVSGIKIATVYRRSIFPVEDPIATLIYCKRSPNLVHTARCYPGKV